MKISNLEISDIIKKTADFDVLYNTSLDAYINETKLVLFEDTDKSKFYYLIPSSKINIYLTTDDGIHYKPAEGISDGSIFKLFYKEWLYVTKGNKDFLKPSIYKPELVISPDDNELDAGIKTILNKVNIVTITPTDTKSMKTDISIIRRDSDKYKLTLNKKIKLLSKITDLKLVATFQNRDTGDFETIEIRLDDSL